MHHPTDMIDHTTAFVTPVVEREIALSFNTRHLLMALLNKAHLDLSKDVGGRPYNMYAWRGRGVQSNAYMARGGGGSEKDAYVRTEIYLIHYH